MERKGEERQILIAMKGHPGTGKSTLATAVAKALKFPLVDKDHFRDCTHTIEQVLMQASPATAAKLLNDLSYEAMWRVISTQLGLGLSVVVDSPLSRQAHLNRLLEMASHSGARVVVVECKPGDEAEWRRRVELRGGSGGSGWHKPSTWQEMEVLLEGYGGCWDYDVGEVPKFVIDTTAAVEVAELVAKVIEFFNS
ncbi:UNVERIFIED_CONTAM: hypothetical protein Sradi_2040100 [Sesamum radiatum]|uniref:Uncharacterized protein n=1 Tax=Sesamum radiatum TaxID=300843 RepID=A0AAW2TGE8_SESRA